MKTGRNTNNPGHSLLWLILLGLLISPYQAIEADQVIEKSDLFLPDKLVTHLY